METPIGKKITFNVISVVSRSETRGKTDVKDLFGKIPIKVDKFFQKYILNLLGEEFHDRERTLHVFQILSSVDSNIDNHIMDEMNLRYSTLNQIRASLEYLSTHFELLDIPDGEEEVNFILGYPESINLQNMVAFIEHEFENGEEEIHLHLRPTNTWGNDLPRGFAE